MLSAPRPTRTIYAGGLDRSTNDERYRVKGGGCIVIGLGVGDRLSVIDPEGAARVRRVGEVEDPQAEKSQGGQTLLA